MSFLRKFKPFPGDGGGKRSQAAPAETETSAGTQKAETAAGPSSGEAARLDEIPSLSSFSNFKRFFIELVLASVVINIFGLALPLALLQIYDRIIPRQSGTTLGLLVVGVVIALGLEGVLKIARSHISGRIGAAFDHKLSMAAFRRLLDSSLPEYEREGASAHTERLRAIAKVREFYSGQAALSLFDLPFAVVYMALIGIFGGWLVTVPIVLLLAFTLVAYFNGHRLYDESQRRSEFDERRFNFIAEALGGIHSIKSMAMEPMIQRRYEMLQEANVKRGFDGARHSIVALNLGSLFSQITIVAIAAMGAVFVINGQMTPGALAACILLGGRSLQPLQGALGTWARFQNFMIARKQIDKLFRLKLAPNVGAPDLPACHGHIRLENVGLKFPSAKNALFEGLELDIKPGECVAILGESGSGKSSLVSVLSGILPPSSGRILIDGHDLARHNTPSIARCIGTLPQRGVLFQGTILENITMFEPMHEAAALDIARRLGLDRVVAGMRNGYDTQVGAGANEAIPSGVRQRIAIARALIHDPQVILFDEANIAIDSAGDEQLRALLESNKGRKTMVLITLRPSLLKLADRIITLADGRLSPGRPTEDKVAALAAENAVAAERPPSDDHFAGNLLSRFPKPSDLAVCLPGLLTAMEWRGLTRHVVEALPHVSDSLDLSGFRRIMANLNYTFRAQHVRLREFDSRWAPCLFVPDDGDAQVLLRYDADQQRYITFNGRTIEMDHLPADDRSGTVHIFRPAEAANRRIETKSWLAQTLLRFQPLMWLTLVITFGINFLSLAGPAFVMLIYNTVIPSGVPGMAVVLMIGAVLALIIDWFLRHLRARILSFVGARSEYIVGGAIFGRILNLPTWAMEQTSIGGQVSRIKDFEFLREMFVGPMALLFYELPGIAVFIVVLTIINPWLLVAILAAVVAFAVLGLATQPGLATNAAAASRAGSERNEFLTDALGKLRALKYSGGEDMWYARFRLLSAKAVESEFNANVRNARVAVFAQTIGTLTVIATLVTCVLGTFSGTTSLGAVVVGMIITWRLVAPMQSGFLSLATLFRIVTSIRQVDNLMRIKTERDLTAFHRSSVAFRGEVQFSRVSFRYSNEADPALLGVSFRAEPGQIIGIAGSNGAGKSTLLKLILGIYQPQAGSVRIDNVDIRQIDPGDLRSMVSYAPQQCDVFYGTIAQNMRLVHPAANDDELRWAAEMAGLYDDIMAMPGGFNHRLMDGSEEHLPNGFRQRVSLSRAYLRPAPIMLFDEPGNGLDNDGDRAFVRAIERLRGRATIFIVSPRPSHLRLANSVIFMEAGYVRQVGTFDQVKNLVLSS